MALVTVLQHGPDVPIGRLDDALARNGVGTRLVRLDLGEPVPALADLGAGLVVLGGQMSAYSDDGAPWLPGARALMAEAVAADVPTLAVCLGAQLLAVACGGVVDVGAEAGREAGVLDVEWLPAAESDPVFGAVAAQATRSKAALMHSDAVSVLPPGAVLLARSQQYPHQAFRLGSARGVQFHPEADASIMAGWAALAEDLDGDAIARQMAAHEAELIQLCDTLAEGFARQVHAVGADR